MSDETGERDDEQGVVVSQLSEPPKADKARTTYETWLTSRRKGHSENCRCSACG